MVDKNYKNDKLYTQTKIMYIRFIMKKERGREQINKQIQRIGERREIEIEGKKQEREEKSKRNRQKKKINRKEQDLLHSYH